MKPETKLRILLSRREYRGKWVTLDDKKIVTKKIEPDMNMQLEFDSQLTKQQLKIFKIAKAEGYFSYPKRISQIRLANKIGVGPGTLCVHLQKIIEKISRKLE